MAAETIGLLSAPFKGHGPQGGLLGVFYLV